MAGSGRVVSDEYSALYHRFISAVFGFTPDYVPITQSVPENGSLVIGEVRVPYTMKRPPFGGPSQHGAYAT
jgi:hypothetical protein